MRRVSNKDFKELIQKDTPVLVDFYADWCGPCKTLAPILDDVETHFGEDLKVLRVNVETNQQLSRKYNVFSVPTMMLFHEGKQEWRVAGVRSRTDIIKVVNKTLGIKPEKSSSGGLFAGLKRMFGKTV